MQLSSKKDDWFALYVKPRHEKSVKKLLDGKGYVTSLPLRKCRHTRSAGTGWESEMPLISGYVFVASDPTNPFRVVSTPGVVRMVGFGTGACAIPHCEIQALEHIASSQLPVASCACTHIGGIVELVRGPLKGVRGVVIREAGSSRLVVGIGLLQRWVSVEIDNTWAVPSEN